MVLVLYGPTKDVASQAVNDAYAGLKALTTRRFPTVSVDQLEQAPGSINRRGVVEEDLKAANAQADAEVVMAAEERST